LHAHLVDEHAEEVKIYVDETVGKMVYELNCPLCDEGVKQPLPKRAAILEEYKREIRMVAFDLLLYHLQDIHDDSNLIQLK
ncbi:MAG: hypothetical protein D6813_03065, partial [Calditrichaeota bacterium]